MEQAEGSARAETVSGNRRVIVLVPGWEMLKRDRRRDTLVAGLQLVDCGALLPAGEVPVGGFRAARLERASPGLVSAQLGAPAVVDVIEAWWGDLVRLEETGGVFSRLGRAAGLVRYWIGHRGLRAMFGISRTISVGLVLGACILLAWFLDLGVVALQSVAAIDPEIGEGPLLSPLRGIVYFSDWIVGYLGLFGLLFLLPLFMRSRAAAVARAIASFSCDYLSNRRDEDGVGLRDTVRLRAAEALWAALAADYDEVVLVGHSFGTMPVIDLLPDLHAEALARLSVVTWGSPAAVMACREAWLAERVAATVVLAGRVAWTDVWSDEDWLCTRVPRPAGDWGPDAELRLSFDTTLGDRVSGRSHLFYFTDARALAPLLRPRQEASP